MKSILLKIDEKLLNETEIHVKELKTSRNTYIKQAVENYNRFLERKKLEKQFAYESLLVREESSTINREFESTLEDGLTDGY
jgi:metal-responsive CopG/Arc/MetJ family transcriptional regulator